MKKRRTCAASSRRFKKPEMPCAHFSSKTPMSRLRPFAFIALNFSRSPGPVETESSKERSSESIDEDVLDVSVRELGGKSRSRSRAPVKLTESYLRCFVHT